MQIVLKMGTKLFCICPYRYPCFGDIMLYQPKTTVQETAKLCERRLADDQHLFRLENPQVVCRLRHT